MDTALRTSGYPLQQSSIDVDLEKQELNDTPESPSNGGTTVVGDENDVPGRRPARWLDSLDIAKYA